MCVSKTKLAIAVLFCSSLLPLRLVAEQQPHMRTALEHMRQAQMQLEQASRDKGGHRVKALGHLKAAMAEVQAGIQYDNAHIEKGEQKRMKH
jgi:hypothetical protein